MGALVYNHDTISAGVETRAHSNWYPYFPPVFVRKFSDTWLTSWLLRWVGTKADYLHVEHRIPRHSWEFNMKGSDSTANSVSSSLNEGDDDL